MIKKKAFPILEFDDTKEAIISPTLFKVENMEFPPFLVITFFKEVIDKLLKMNMISHFYTVSGENNLILYKYNDCDVLIMHGITGCPACAGYLDELTGMGITKVMFCGGGGVLDKQITVGKIIVVVGAIRDEGFSYHYLPPSRIVYADEVVVKCLSTFLEQHNIDYLHGITWTTDAFFRETKELVKYRKEEGAIIVEMEQAGCLAVALYRNIKYGALLYGGDDVSQNTWDKRSWRSREDVRFGLVDICKTVVKLL